MKTLEVTTRSGFRLRLEDAGTDVDGYQLWRQAVTEAGIGTCKVCGQEIFQRWSWVSGMFWCHRLDQKDADPPHAPEA